MEVSALQVILIVVGSNATLVLALVFILQKFGPNLFNWMRAKIDAKNGAIGELVEEVKRLATSLCKLVEQSHQRQDDFLTEVREVCARKDEQIARLVEEINDALGRAT